MHIGNPDSLKNNYEKQGFILVEDLFEKTKVIEFQRVTEKLGTNQPNSDIRTDRAVRKATYSPYGMDHGVELVHRAFAGAQPTGDFSDEIEVHAIEHPAGALYSTGAAGSAATSDGTGYSARAEIESISPLIANQVKSPQGSPGGSPSSGSFST